MTLTLEEANRCTQGEVMYMTYDQYIRRLAWRFWHGDYNDNDIELAGFALDIKAYIESHPSEFDNGYVPQ